MASRPEDSRTLKLKGIVETAMAGLGFVWMALLIIDLTLGLGRTLNILFNSIWAAFIVDFVVRFIVAPKKLEYLKDNWLSAISLMIPALRIFRIFRAIKILRMARVVRGIRMARLFASFRRSMRAFSVTMQRRGFAYVGGITVIVAFIGAAGMYAFERSNDGFTSYWHALWWTAMLLTTIASDYWPVTTEGRILSLVLSVYAVSVLGYIAATLASYFIGRDTDQAVSPRDVRRLRETINRLREEVRQRQEPPGGQR